METMTEFLAERKAETVPPAKPKQRKPRAKPSPATAAAEGDATAWAQFGVALTLVLSALLNGYANSQHAPVAWAGWLLGLAIPTLVLVLSKVAGETYRAGRLAVARGAGGSGIALLFLSVWHCSESIALLTGSGLVLAVPMAVAIDCGLVACEVAIVSGRRH